MPDFSQPPEVAPKPKRDRYSRPFVQHPVTGETEPYTRCTTLAGSIEDTYNLGQWAKRKVAFGMGRREDLQMLAAAIQDDEDAIAKAQLQEIADKAMEAAEAGAAARIGTALHAFTDEYDRTGKMPRTVPKAFRPDVEAYARALDKWKLQPLVMEQFRVVHSIKAAGTTDRLYLYVPDNTIIIGDTKSGEIKWGQPKMAIQLAIYANGRPYVPDADGSETGTTLDDPYPVDRDRGVIMHLPRGKGVCEPHWIDLRKGAQGVKLCLAVRAWRKETGLLVPFAN
jgi:hypothetical protein